jgi:hypothetical protein
MCVSDEKDPVGPREATKRLRSHERCNLNENARSTSLVYKCSLDYLLAHVLFGFHFRSPPTSQLLTNPPPPKVPPPMMI